MTILVLTTSGQGSSGSGAPIAVLIVLAVLAGRRISLRIWPFGRCRRCDGTGRNDGSNRNRWGPCKRCGGSGRRRRTGARKPN